MCAWSGGGIVYKKNEKKKEKMRSHGKWKMEERERKVGVL